MSKNKLLSAKNILEKNIADIILYLYKIITYLFYPFIVIFLFLRVIRGKEDRARFWEKLGIFSNSSKIMINGEEKTALSQPLWFHAASIGEMQSIIEIIKRIQSQNKDLSFVITTCTKSSGEIFTKMNMNNCVHCYAPIDIPQAVNSFIAFWQPKIAIFVESEIWPNLLFAAQKHCSVILCNARMSPSSFCKWKMISFVARRVMSYFNKIMVGDLDTYNRMSQLGIKNHEYLGNIKFSSSPLNCDLKELKNLGFLLSDRMVILAASTHKGEEEMILRVFHKILSHNNNPLLIIVPRHITRSEEIESMLLSNRELLNNGKIAVRSKRQEIDEKTSVYLADTIGELGLFYRLACISFVGGSMIKHGGQNMLEAARLGCPVIVGPHTFNFPEIVKLLKEKNCLLVAKDEEDLYFKIEDLLMDEEKRRIFAENAEKAGKVEEKALNKTVAIILEQSAYR